MGLYSTNRIGAFSESADIRSIIEEIEQTPYDPDFGSLMEVSNMIAEADQMMFETLLQADFISVTNESVMLEAEAEEANMKGNEVKKEGILSKIKQIIDTVIEAIKKAVSNFIAKISSIIKNDKKLVEKYKSILTSDKLSGWKGISKFRCPKDIDAVSAMKNYAAGIKDIWTEFESKVANSKSREEVDDAARKALDLTHVDYSKEGEKNARNNMTDLFFEKEEENFTPSAAQISDALKKLTNANEILKNVKQIAAKSIADLKSIKQSVHSSLKKRREAHEIEIYVANKAYTVISAVCKYANKQLSFVTNLTARQFAAYRKLVLLAGRYASKGKEFNVSSSNLPAVVRNEAAMLEEAFYDAIAESSDTYVFEHLGYGLY